MSFNIYDPKGYRYPYHPESDWRNVPKTEEIQPYAKAKKEGEEDSDKRRRRESAINVVETERFKKRSPLPSEREGVIYASQIMKKPVITLSPDTPLPEAWDLIREHRFRHVPVVNKEGKLIGILSDRTILKEIAPFNKRKNHKFEEVTVEDIMSQPVLTAHPNTDINFIAKIFINERIGAMPIIDEDHKILGIITRSDILRTIVKVDLLEIRI